MPRTLYVTTELPYFPGQGGLMSLHIGYLAGVEMTGVLGPRYPHQPEDALQRLRDTVQRSYWWPEHPVPGDFLVAPVLWDHHTRWLRKLPGSLKLFLWRHLTGLHKHSDDALVWRDVLTNLAPKLLEAIREERWNTVLLSQSLSAAWFRFLPRSMSRCLYFHDIRSDYLGRSPNPPSRDNLRRILLEEQMAAQQVDAIAVVSNLDRIRAERKLHPTEAPGVAPICVDLNYFAFQPNPAPNPIVLFTGHLSHPPNVDAALYFLASIWPKILKEIPEATFQLVGLHPSPAVAEAVALAQRVELASNVPDIRPYYRSSAVYVVPMRYGGGVRQKIIEAWAVGLPVVTTTMGAEGIEAQDGTNCWLRDTPGTFASQVVGLLRESTPPSIVQAARLQAETKHSSSVSSPILAKQINLAVSRQRATSSHPLRFALAETRRSRRGRADDVRTGR